MFKKRGFTLVELLAVIVILAIILAIAVPAITGIINNATRDAFDSDARMLIKAIEYKLLEDDTYFVEDLNENNIEAELNISGDNYDSLMVTTENGNIFVMIEGQNRWAGLIACGTYMTMEVGEDIECTIPMICGDNIFDERDGKEYSTVRIGNQCWMQEDLRYDNGCSDNPWTDSIPFNSCSDNESEEYSAMHYQWWAVMDWDGETPSNQSELEGTQGICPDEWYVPTDEDWKQLEIYLGMSRSQANEVGDRGTDEGDKLKDSTLDYWCADSPECGISGFNALPSGRRLTGGDIYNIGANALLWSSSPSDSNAWRRDISRWYSQINRNDISQASGYVVRCLRQ